MSAYECAKPRSLDRPHVSQSLKTTFHTMMLTTNIWNIKNEYVDYVYIYSGCSKCCTLLTCTMMLDDGFDQHHRHRPNCILRISITRFIVRFALNNQLKVTLYIATLWKIYWLCFFILSKNAKGAFSKLRWCLWYDMRTLDMCF